MVFACDDIMRSRCVRTYRRSSFVVASLCVVLFATAVSAQAPGAPSSPESAAQEVRPPELIERAEATYPADAAKLEQPDGVVVLRVKIDVEGRVTEAEVIEPLGHGFDEAAREAVLQYRFKPAERRGRPVPAHIWVRYEFKLPSAPAVASVTGTLRGVVVSGGAALISAEVTLTGPEAAALELRALTDASGAFLFEQLQPGTYSVLVTKAGQTRLNRVDIPSATETQLTVDLPAPSPASFQRPLEVTVKGRRSESERLQQSAEAVNVVDTSKAKRQTADLGEVLARTQGVAVRRDGGLGSTTRFSLNGLYDDQIRLFLDAVPLDLAGYPFGIANVPVNLIERVEVYRGVVPIRFGADALGGGVNLVGDRNYENHAGLSYQVGSFGTHRFTLDGRYRHEPTGIIFGGTGFFDITKNDYKVDVNIPDDRGQLHPATVPRFHDGYRAYGTTLEAGVVDRPWAKRLLLHGFLSGYDKQLQNNIVMTVPYGEAHYGETVYGVTARYEVALNRQLELELLGNYAHRTIDYVDKSQWVYDWYGHRVRPRVTPAEVDTQPHDQTVWQESAYGRVLVKWAPVASQTLRVSLTPNFTTRNGKERIQRTDSDARDPLATERYLFTFVSGIEYELTLFDDRLSNVLFVKDYFYDARSEEPLLGNVFRKRNVERHTQGVGDSLRYRFTPWLYGKASYEYATRLPRPDEVFGNGVLVLANLGIEPEVSHNFNFGVRAELRRMTFGDFTLDVNAFLRESDRLIVLLGSDNFFMYQNVYKARGVGLENALNWVSPGRHVSLDGMLTWQDIRNVSSSGTFADFNGDRIPNRPYLFGSWGARLRFTGLLRARDTFEPFYNGRYVHAFFRAWESQGLREYKQTIDSQVVHSIGVSWNVQSDSTHLSTTAEIDNLTNAKVFDNFGVQRPGRAFYLKVTGEI